jgi:hypothetical protein
MSHPQAVWYLILKLDAVEGRAVEELTRLAQRGGSDQLGHRPVPLVEGPRDCKSRTANRVSVREARACVRECVRGVPES